MYRDEVLDMRCLVLVFNDVRPKVLTFDRRFLK